MQLAGKTLYKRIPFFIVILCLLTRLPQLLSDKLILDGDECVVALMAKHIYVGKDFPIFFYGQSYGFSLVEALTIVPFYAVLGISTMSVKLAMLSLWTAAVVFLYRVLVLLNNGKVYLPVLLMLIFICSPTWAVWSMKARGGYLTSFLLSSISMHLVFNEALIKKSAICFLQGVILVLVYQSQPFWLAGLLPLLTYMLVKTNSARCIFSCLAGIIVLAVTFYFSKQSLPKFHDPPLFIPIGMFAKYIARVPAFFLDTLHGNYFLSNVQSPNFFCLAFAYAFEALVFVQLIAAVYFIATGKKGASLFIVSSLGVLLVLTCSIFTYRIEPRYLLPVSGFATVSLLLLLQLIPYCKAAYYGATLLLIAGAVAIPTFYDFSFCNNKEKDLKMAIGRLEQNDIHYLFCQDDFLSWELMFYSNEAIIYRGPWAPGRYPEYFNSVDSAFARHEKTAVFGDTTAEYSVYRNRLIGTHYIGHYFYSLCPSKEALTNVFY